MARKHAALALVVLGALVTALLPTPARGEVKAYFQVCKEVKGGSNTTFTFMTNDVAPDPANSGPRTFTVPAGGCSDYIQGRPGAAWIKEIGPTGWQLVGVQPQSTSVSFVNGIVVFPVDPDMPAKITLINKGSDLEPVRRRVGRVKVCKVAGPGVGVGTVSTFTVQSALATEAQLAVPAGAAPSGNCVLSPELQIGQGPDLFAGRTATVTEAAQKGVVVSGITVDPLARLSGPPDLGNRTVEVALEGGVTEVTFTNRVPAVKFGYVELCVRDPRRLAARHVLTVRDRVGEVGTYVVSAAGCSAAIPVAAGTVAIEIDARGGAKLTGCRTYPKARQGTCDRRQRTARVMVPAGDASTQSVAFLTVR